MNREEAIRLLTGGEEGIAQWNESRRFAFADQLPSLDGANLKGANLDLVDLSAVDLNGADLSGAQLSRACLLHAQLRKANLTGASIEWTNFGGADLSKADLEGALPFKADFSDANLEGACLKEFDFRRTYVWGTVLRKADLRQANFGWVNLGGGIRLDDRSFASSAARNWYVNPFDNETRRAVVHAADLSFANAEGATFAEANLQGVSLRGANLREANLFNANLRNSDLRDANLCDATLSGADLMGSCVADADFHGATLGGTLFGGLVLSEAKNLEFCRHISRSLVDHLTLQYSRPLPLSFLQRCGLPDSVIELYGTHRSDADYYSCFISYSSKDEGFAKHLEADLQKNGVRCWFAPDKLKMGDPIRDKIDEVIASYDKVVVVLSKDSVNSKWVEDEVESAMERESGRVVVFPIRIDDAVLGTTKAWAAKLRRQRHIGDFTQWKNDDSYQKAFQRMLRDLKVARADERSE